MNTKKKILGGLGLVFLFLIILGIYNNPDRKTKKINAELEQISNSMNLAMQRTKQSIAENEACFSDESLKTGKSAECVMNIRNIQENFKATDEENIARLETYYQNNQSSISDDNKDMIENSLRLYKSKYYSSFVNAYNQYFNSFIEWHKYYRDYVEIKGVDNLTSIEIMRAKTLAQNILTAEEDLKLKVSAFSDYINENFSNEFVSGMTQSSIK
jgi:hypothetical protein